MLEELRARRVSPRAASGEPGAPGPRGEKGELGRPVLFGLVKGAGAAARLAGMKLAASGQLRIETMAKDGALTKRRRACGTA